MRTKLGYHNEFTERGAALVTSLVILVILTLIGVSALRNVTLSERMSGNLRDTNIAFQAAESCLASAFADPDALVTQNGQNQEQDNVTHIGSGNAMGSYKMTAEFDGYTKPLVGSGYSVLHFQQIHNSVHCRGAKGTNPDEDSAAKVDLAQGFSQIVPKSN